VRPSILAAWRDDQLETNFDACTTGRSAGLAPFEDATGMGADLTICAVSLMTWHLILGTQS
jgi:hypothetical protein